MRYCYSKNLKNFEKYPSKIVGAPEVHSRTRKLIFESSQMRGTFAQQYALKYATSREKILVITKSLFYIKLEPLVHSVTIDILLVLVN